MNNLSVLILAAGKGTRMVSNRAKVLHKLCGVPMLQLVYRSASMLDPDETLVVVGYDAERVEATLEGCPVRFITQEKQMGTGHAVMAAREALEGKRGSDLIVLFGDTPCVRSETLRKLFEHHRRSGVATTLLTTRAADPFGYGRILRDGSGHIQAIVEERDATADQKRITEVNPGFYCFQVNSLLESLGKLTSANAQGEYYITDLVKIQRGEGKTVHALLHEDFEELRGINSREQLAELSLSLGKAKNQKLMASGVTLIDPERAYIHLDAVIERDTTIYPVVTLEGGTHVGEGSVIRPGCRISNSHIGSDVEILDGCVITDSAIGSGCSIGPAAHIRDHSTLGPRCSIGNYVEIVRSTLEDEARVRHLSYLGDSLIGNRVNIGAGVITCNFDGERKNVTIIEDDVFVGTDSQLIAPLRIGHGAFIAAGSTITEDVPPGALGISRVAQVIDRDWVERRKKKIGKSDD